MNSSPNLDQMTPEQLRALTEQALQLLSQVDSMGQKIHRLVTLNEQLAHDIAIFKRHKFAKRSEQLSPDQVSLLDDLLDTQCACGCQLQRIGEGISEKLDYTPGVFTVEQHVRGKNGLAASAKH